MTVVEGRLRAPLRWLPITRPGVVALSGGGGRSVQPLLLLTMKLPPGLREGFGVVAALGQAGFWVPAHDVALLLQDCA